MEFTKASIHGNIDDIVCDKHPLEFHQIAKLADGSWPELILVEGAPGVGKSTFAWKLCRKWKKGKILSQYKLVVLLRLRDKHVREAKTLYDLFFYDDPEKQKLIVKEIIESEGKEILLLFEGYDELPAQLQRDINSVLLQLISGKRLPEATILVTSRHSASGFLRNKYWRRISQHIEILGFTKENIQTYINENVEDSEERQGLERYLSCYPHIRTMMYVPLNSVIVVEVYHQCHDKDKPAPKTMTELYTSLVRTLLIRYLSDNPSYKHCTKIIEFTDLPDKVYEQLQQICKTAYGGVANGQELIFYDLPDGFETLGLMQEVHELYVDKGDCVSYNFLHLTIQEYLAAVHLSMQPMDVQIQHFKEKEAESSFVMVLKFLSGLTKFHNYPKQDLALILEPEGYRHGRSRLEPQDYRHGRSRLEPQGYRHGQSGLEPQGYRHGRSRFEPEDYRYGRSRFEPEDYRYGRSRFEPEDYRYGRSRFEPEDYRHGRSRFEPEDYRYGRSRFEPEDCIHGQSELELQDNRYGRSRLNFHWLFEAQNVEYISSVLKKDVFSVDDLSTPFEAYALGYCVAHSNFKWHSRYTLDSTMSDMLIRGLQAEETQCEGSLDLTELEIVINNDIKPTTLRFLSGITKITVKGNEIEMENCKSLGEWIRSSTSLRHFTMDILPPDEGQSAGLAVDMCSCLEPIVTALGQDTSLESVSFPNGLFLLTALTALMRTGRSELYPRVLQLLKDVRFDDKNETLFLGEHYTDHPNTTAKYLSPEKIRSFYIKNIPCRYVGDSSFLSDLCSLSKLVIEGCRLSGNRIKCITEGFLVHCKGIASKASDEEARSACTLEHIELTDCSIGPSEVQHLAQALCVNTSVKTLKLFNNYLGDEGAKALAEMLGGNGAESSGTVNTTLEHVDLSRCDIGRLGAQHLAQALCVNTSVKTLKFFEQQVHY